MPITIGAKQESDFTDPIGLLGDCHRRIERFLAVLAKLSEEHRGAMLSTGEREALAASLRYFRDAAPKHTADEEESLFPRMRAANDEEAAALLNRVGALEHDHQVARKLHEEVDALGQAWLSDGALSPDDASRLASAVGRLTSLYARHIAIEDAEVFPCAAKILSPADRSAVGLEMAARRGLRGEQ